MPRPRLCSTLSSQSLTLLTILSFSLLACPVAQAQTYKVLYNFTGRSDGRFPLAGVVLGPDGNLYGTTGGGWFTQNCTENGIAGCGTVFELTQTSSGWNLQTLYSFRGGNDGVAPVRIIFAPDGNIYGATLYGGDNGDNMNQQCLPGGCGTVFKLSPGQGGNWTESVPHRFQGPPDGQQPVRGALVLDSAGNLYGTTTSGGRYLCGQYGDTPCGVAYELTPSGDRWNESIIWNFGNGDGSWPSNVITDDAGNLYGALGFGGGYACSGGCGMVFELSPSPTGWSEKVLFNFNSAAGVGHFPDGGLLFDQVGNLYGSTFYGPGDGAGTVYELTPTGAGWGHQTLYSLPGQFNTGTYGSLLMDGAGNLYGVRGDVPSGAVYKLTHTDAGWSYSELHNFNGAGDGGSPAAYLTMDLSGNLYGTTYQGGAYGYGVVFEITP